MITAAAIYSIWNRGLPLPFYIQTGSTKTQGGRQGDPGQGNHYELLGALSPSSPPDKYFINIKEN